MNEDIALFLVKSTMTRMSSIDLYTQGKTAILHGRLISHCPRSPSAQKYSGSSLTLGIIFFLASARTRCLPCLRTAFSGLLSTVSQTSQRALPILEVPLKSSCTIFSPPTKARVAHDGNKTGIGADHFGSTPVVGLVLRGRPPRGAPETPGCGSGGLSVGVSRSGSSLPRYRRGDRWGGDGAHPATSALARRLLRGRPGHSWPPGPHLGIGLQSLVASSAFIQKCERLLGPAEVLPLSLATCQTLLNGPGLIPVRRGR